MTLPFRHQEIHLRDYLYVLRKRRKAIGIFFLIILAAGLIFTFTEKVLYQATATILIERENPNVVDFKEVMAFDASTTDYYQTQYQMLESRSLIAQLIQEEKLDEDPYLTALRRGKLRRLLSDNAFASRWLGEFMTEPALEDLFIRRMLRVDPVRNSRLVHVSVRHPDPVRSSELTNRLVEQFIQRNLENRFLISQRAMELISKQLIELKDKVGLAELELQKYKEEQGLLNIPSIREKDKFIQDAKLELVKIQAEESKLAKRYLPAHPRRIHIRSQIEGLEEKLREEEEKTLEVGRKGIEYAELEREAESARQTYEALLSRLEQTHSEAQTQSSNILVVDPAEPPRRPHTPRPILNFLVALFLGALGGVLLAFFIEYLDSTVRIPEDIEKGLGLELLGIIPQASRASRDAIGVELLFSPEETSPVSESFRALRTALLFRLRHVGGCRTLLVTSPNPEEGKSTVSVNLAAAFQQNHLRVLLIDADLRKPRLHKFLKLGAEKGLTEVLEGELSIKDGIHPNASGLGFDFLSCGSPSRHPTEILGSQEMKNLIKTCEESYDILLIDSPPYLPVADVAVLNEYTKGVVVVARYHTTDRRHLRDIKRRFGGPPEGLEPMRRSHEIERRARMVGVVINQVSVREQDYYYHQYYYYGYGDAERAR